MSAILHARLWSGPPTSATSTVVLLHGIVSSRYLVPTARQLAGSCTVVAPDMPGFGRTPGRTPLAISETADVVATWMAASGLEGSTVVGHSVGAQTAADLAARHPGTVGALVLVGPTVDRQARSVPSLVRRWTANARDEPLSFNALAAYELAEIGPARMLGSLRHAVDDVIEDKLPAVACPVLLVRGERDRIAPQEWLDELQRRRSDAGVSVLSQAAHTVVYTRPVELAQVVLDFAGRG
ncbi:MAG TPA: alpha/beta hydrolase [Acidimicrobiales bacterium]|nr:alpha/beta hydrolase [Acidimicrobiales bacterium]